MTHDMHDSERWIFWKFGLMCCDGFAPIRKCNYGRYDSDYSHQRRRQDVSTLYRYPNRQLHESELTNPNLMKKKKHNMKFQVRQFAHLRSTHVLNSN